MTMVAIANWSNERFLYEIRRPFQESPVPVDAAEVHAQHQTVFPNVNSGNHLFAFDARFGINQHISTPTVSTADGTAEIVANMVHCLIKIVNEAFVLRIYEIKFWSIQKIVHQTPPHFLNKSIIA